MSETEHPQRVAEFEQRPAELRRRETDLSSGPAVSVEQGHQPVVHVERQQFDLLR